MQKLIDVENLLIWAFQQEAASLRDDGLDVTAGYPQDCIVRCEQVSVMGGFITGTSPGARVLAADSHPDAVTTTDTLNRLPRSTALLCASHAKAGSRPDWQGEHRFVPKEWRYDESGEDYAMSEICYLPDEFTGWKAWYWCGESRKSVRTPKPRWCPVVEMDSEKVIAKRRRTYLEWWEGLDFVRQNIGPLADWRLSDIMPEQFPWARGQPMSEANAGVAA